MLGVAAKVAGRYGANDAVEKASSATYAYLPACILVGGIVSPNLVTLRTGTYGVVAVATPVAWSVIVALHTTAILSGRRVQWL